MLTYLRLSGNVLLSANIFRHVTRDHAFKNEFLFYRFTEHEPNKVTMRSFCSSPYLLPSFFPLHLTSAITQGIVAKKEDGSDVSWLDFLQRGFESKYVLITSSPHDKLDIVVAMCNACK